MRRLARIIRSILLLAVAAIVVLAGVLAFNVVTHGSRQLQVAAVPRATIDTDGAATRLAEFKYQWLPCRQVTHRYLLRPQRVRDA